MKECYEIDANGCILETYLYDTEQINKAIEEGRKIIDFPWKVSFHKPIFDSEINDWVEGKPQSEIIDSIRAAKIAALKEQCNLVIRVGFSSVDGNFYGFNYHDQMNFTQQKLEMDNDNTISSVTWKSVNNGVSSLTREQFYQVIEDAKTHKNNNIHKFWVLEQRVLTATTIEEINLVLW